MANPQVDTKAPERFLAPERTPGAKPPSQPGNELLTLMMLEANFNTFAALNVEVPTRQRWEG